MVRESWESIQSGSLDDDHDLILLLKYYDIALHFCAYSTLFYRFKMLLTLNK